MTNGSGAVLVPPENPTPSTKVTGTDVQNNWEEPAYLPNIGKCILP